MTLYFNVIQDTKLFKTYFIPRSNSLFHILFNEDVLCPETSFNQQYSKLIQFDLLELLSFHGKLIALDKNEALPINDLISFLKDFSKAIPASVDLSNINYTNLTFVENNISNANFKSELEDFISWLSNAKNDNFMFYYLEID